MSEQSSKHGNDRRMNMDLGREVIHCQACGLIQYRTRIGNCRRCLHLLAPNVEVLIRPSEPQGLLGDNRRVFERSPNYDIVENIGQRIRHLRGWSRMTQGQLRARSRVSKSYLSRIESGQFTPSLITLEKITEALGVGLGRCFVPKTTGETILEDPFIRDLHPFVLKLDWEQRQSILKRLAAISNHVSNVNAKARAFLAQGRSVRMKQLTRSMQPAATGQQ